MNFFLNIETTEIFNLIDIYFEPISKLCSTQSWASKIVKYESQIWLLFQFPKNVGESDIGDIDMLVTLWWWLIWNVGGRIIILATFFVC